MPHWIKAHQDDPDCPPMRTKRDAKIPRSQRPPNVQAVKFMKKRYRETGAMEPLNQVCNVLDNPKTRTSARLAAAELAWEMTHGKIAPAQAVAAVQVNQQVVQGTLVEGQPSGQLTTGERAHKLAGLLTATAVLGDVRQGAPTGEGAGTAGGAASGGDGAAGIGTDGCGGTGA